MRAGIRSQRVVEIPMTAMIMPSTTPMTVADTEMIKVLTSPVFRSCGSTCHIASKSRNVFRRLSSQFIEYLSRYERSGRLPGALGPREARGHEVGEAAAAVCSALGRYWGVRGDPGNHFW